MDFSFLEESSKQGSDDQWKRTYRKDLEPAITNFMKRGLVHTAKWLSELLYVLRDTVLEENDRISTTKTDEHEDASYYMCKCYFDLKEYDRCAYFAEKGDSACLKFLYFYAKYLALEKKRVEDMTEPTCSLDSPQTILMSELRAEIEEERSKNGLDSYCSYLYGVVCKKLDLRSDALEAFCDAVRKEPLNWGAWEELANIIDDVRISKTLDIPHEHWMKLFFLGHLFVEHQNNSAAIQVYWVLRNRGLNDCRYISAQLGISYHNHRVVDKAAEEFARLHAADPYRLEHIDMYSNLLYVKEDKVLLSHLAHRACEIDKYRVETCCIVGNLYSLRQEHQKAVLYFQRALKINPQYLSAWTLMGHEYMELKNSNAAIQSYRHAIEANKRDYRAWYGLGQTYEILRMPSYGLYYYQQAHTLRPNDSRMLSAMGDQFERLGQNNNAIRSYKLARNVGDIEGTATLKLAKLLQKLNQTDMAAMMFKEYVVECEMHEPGDKSELCRAYKFLAGYCLKTKSLTDAYNYAQKCLSYEEAKEEAKALLIDIAVAQKNPEKEADSPMDEELEVEGEGERPGVGVALLSARRLWNSPTSSGGDSTCDTF